MKRLAAIIQSVLPALLIAVSVQLSAQSKATSQTVEIKTTAVCGMCKERIEKAMAFEKGVNSADLNLSSKLLTVVFNPKKTNEDKIRQAVARVGYDADGVPADPEAYEALPACCKKDAPPH